MLLFLTTLRHPHNVNDAARGEQLLAWTLASVCAQTCPDFHVLVVANRPPDRRDWPAAVRARTTVCTVRMPAPSPRLSAGTDMHAVRRDRGTKLALGLLHPLAAGARHVMPFDADDFLSRDLCAWVAQRPETAGWFVRDGFVMYGGQLAPLSPFNRYCGTCNIVSTALLTAPLRAAEPEIGVAAEGRYH